MLAVVADVAGAVTGAADDFAGTVVALLPDPPPLPEPPPLLSPVVVAGPPPPEPPEPEPEPSELDPPEPDPPPEPPEPDPPPELPEPESLDSGAELPTVFGTLVEGVLTGALLDGAALVLAGEGVVWPASAVAGTVPAVEMTGAAVVGVVEAIVVSTLTTVVDAAVEVGAASAGAEISQTDCPEDGPRFGNNVWRTA